MSTVYRRQSRKPKPLTQQQLIGQFRRGMEEHHGLTVHVDYGSGLYTPSLQLSVWPPMKCKTAPDVRREEVTAS